MISNLKKRIYTSIILIFIVLTMLINNYVLGYFLIIVSILSLLEFARMTMKIYVNEKLNLLLLIRYSPYMFLYLVLHF